MKHLPKKYAMPAAITLGLIAGSISAIVAGEGFEYGLRRCPGCGSCKSEAKLEKDKKTTFTVECKEICIPPVQFPWSKCKPAKCGYVKAVRVLKKGSKPVEKCTYEWTVEKCDEKTAVQPVAPQPLPGVKPFDDPDDPSEE